MKSSKFLICFILCASLWTCNDNDEFDNSENDEPTLFFDVNSVIAQPEETDITNFVTFNGQNALLYTSELFVGASLHIDRPEGLAVSTIFKYDNLRLFKRINDELVESSFEANGINEDENLQLFFSNTNENFKIHAINAESIDNEYVYIMEVRLIIDDVSYGPYFITSNIRLDASD